MKTKIATMFLSLSLLFSAVAWGAPKPGEMRPVAVCRDGKTYWNDSGEHRGACSGHKGVASWKDGSPVANQRGKHSKIE